MPRPQESSRVAASVKSRTSCDAIERGSVRLEDITHAADGMDQFGLERIVYLRPQAAHHHVHDIGIGLKSDVPYVFRNFSARYNFARRANQMNEEKKLLGREIERHAGTNRLVPSHINVQIVDAQTFCLSLGSAPQYRAHPGQQFRKRERLYQIIVRAQFEA